MHVHTMALPMLIYLAVLQHFVDFSAQAGTDGGSVGGGNTGTRSGRSAATGTTTGPAATGVASGRHLLQPGSGAGRSSGALVGRLG